MFAQQKVVFKINPKMIVLAAVKPDQVVVGFDAIVDVVKALEEGEMAFDCLETGTIYISVD